MRRQGNAKKFGGTLCKAFDFGALIGLAARYRHADHWQFGQRLTQGQGQAAMGAGTARGQDHGSEVQAGLFDLRGQFDAGTYVT
ncbi:hypothetical protein D3C81_1990110 [compost metagenome]